VTELRLSGGRFRGRRLRVAHGVRPSEGKVREALFSIWQTELPGARLLDLFAGSGAVGFEALGRGAGAAVLVEGDPRVAKTLKENAATLGLDRDARIYRMRLPAALAMLRERERPFDLIFADPPYGYDEGPRLVSEALPLLAPGGSLCFEHRSRDAAPVVAGAEHTGTRCYGESCLSFYEPADAADEASPARLDSTTDDDTAVDDADLP
jgi:16S rRNA (guanine966-N2)-methyltransferase